MADQQIIDRLASIQGIRPDVAERVAGAFPDAAALSGATQEQLAEVKGIGAVTAARIVDEFAGEATVRSAGDETPTTPTPEPERAPVRELEPLRREAEQVETPVDTIKVAAKVVTAGAFAVVGTVREQLPEVKQSVGKAAGAVVQLGRELGRAFFRRAS